MKWLTTSITAERRSGCGPAERSPESGRRSRTVAFVSAPRIEWSADVGLRYGRALTALRPTGCAADATRVRHADAGARHTPDCPRTHVTTSVRGQSGVCDGKPVCA